MIDSLGLAADIGLVTKNGSSIPLTGVFADAEIIGKSSIVKITQKFKNEGIKAIEAVYRFPLPESSSVTGFCIKTKNKTIKGELEERDKAFETYDNALIKGDGAVLLDQERPNIFTLSVGNLNPGIEVNIEIEYISVLDFKDNILRFFLPTTISPRYIPVDTPEEGGIPVSDKVHPEYSQDVPYGLGIRVNIVKTLGINLSSISSPSHKIKTSVSDSHCLIEFTSEIARMDRDFILETEYQENNSNNAFYFKKDKEGFVQAEFTPDFKSIPHYNIKDSLSAKRDTVFVLDCSGSMAGSSIAQAKKALEILIKALEPGQRFNIYRFGSNFDKRSNKFLVFGEETLSLALKFLRNTDANFGGTEILEPLKDIVSNITESNAYEGESKKGTKNIILVTDGEVGNEQAVLNLVKSNKENLRLFTVGIGFGPNEYFVKEMAVLTGGDYLIVHPEERIDLKVISLFKKLNIGAIEDLKIDLGICDSMVDQVPGSMSAFDRNSYSLYAKISNDSVPGNIVIKGMYNGKELEWNLPVTDGASGNKEISLIPKFWAREKIRELENNSFNLIGSKQKERKNKNIENLIIELSKTYGVISSRTSFVSVEERSEEEKTKGEAVLKKVPTLVTYGWHGMGSFAPHPMASRTAVNYLFNTVEINHVACDKLSINPDADIYSQKISGNSKKRLNANSYVSKSILSSQPVSMSQLKENILLEILSCQLPAGGFKTSSNLNKFLEISEEEIGRLTELIATKGEEINLNIKKSWLETALVIAILNKYFNDFIDSWGSIISKSKTWLEKNIKIHNPQIGGKPLNDYILDYIQDLSF